MAGVTFQRLLGIDPDSRTSIASAKRNSGFSAEQVLSTEFNQLFYKSQIDEAWGTQDQVTANEATFYTDSSGEARDSSAAIVTLENDSRIVMVHNVTATDNILFNPSSGSRFQIQSEVGLDIDMGNAGSLVPYKLIFGPDVEGAEILLNISNRFEDIPFDSDDEEKRFIANQGIRNKIKVNETTIYDPSRCGEIVIKDSYPLDNPYLIRMDGRSENWQLHTTPATNNTIAWFRDLNKYLQGYRDGSEVASRFTLSALISASPHLFQVNTAYSMLRDISSLDDDIHSREDSNGVSISATVDFDGSSTVTFQSSIGNVKNFMRISGGTIPDGSSATTILINIDDSALTATMIDALTFSEVSVATASSVSATIDNSGAAGGSNEDDAIMNHEHIPESPSDAGSASLVHTSGSNSGVRYLNLDSHSVGSAAGGDFYGTSGPKEPVTYDSINTSTENNVKNTGIYLLYRG